MIASSDFENPFQGLETSFLQDKYIRDTMSNVEPKEVKLGETLKMKIVRNKRRFVVENECFMYVPLTDSLQVFLENSRIREMVLSNSKTAPPGYFYDFFDGSVVTNHHLSGGDLGLIIYFDEIELCNPLGSKTGRHKMSMFYYSVLNIDVKFRSKLEAIRLLAVVESHVMKKYGIDKILEPFVNDMIRMSNGVDFTFDDGERNIRAYLIAAVGDTPASNCLGGFKESVGAAFIKCRECMCTLQQMKVCFDSNNFTTRHMELHEQQCHQIESADTEYMRNHLSTTFGISRRSSLINVPHFNVCNMMPQDLMHVVLEGVAQYEIKEVIKLFLKEKSFSLTQFNTMLKTFHYPYFDIKSKPSVLLPTTLTSDDNRLRQSASQMLVFIKVLPFIMHSFTERENVYLQFIAELMTIVNILLSPIISIGSVITLKHLIKVHLEKFTRLFPYCSIIPKQHYMCHWPETIMRFGPPVRFSCMRFEGKHKVFKNMAKNQNFINLKKSLTEDYLKSECISKDVESEEDHPIFSSEKIIGTTKQCENIQRESEVISSFYPGIQNIRNVHFCSNIVLNGTKYIPNQCVLVVSCTDLQPIFGLLKKISIVTSDDDQNIVFYFEEFETLHFDNQMQAYVIDVPTLAQGYVLKKPSDCLDYSCYSVVHYENKTFVPIRNDLTSLIELNNDGATNLFS